MRRGGRGVVTAVLVASALAVSLVTGVATAPPAAAAAPTPTAARTGVPANIYAIGDSITTATGTGQLGSEQKANSWVTGNHPSSIPSPRDGSPNVLSMRHRLGIPQGSAFNLAANGKRMADFDDQANQLPATAQYVVVELGGNDLCRPTVAEMTSEASYRAELRAGLAAVRTRAPNALIFVASIPDIYNLWYLRGAPESVNPHVNDSPDQAGRARFFWDNPTGFVIPCESLLANPSSTSTADNNRRQQVRARNIAFNQILEEECGAVLRCRYDADYFFNQSSNRVSPPNGPLKPRANWWFENRDISYDQGPLNSFCPVNFTYDGCGDHFHPSFAGQAKLALAGHESSYQFQNDATAPTVTITPARPPDGNGVYAGAVGVSFGGTDANGLRGQEVRIHQPNGSIGAWQPSIGVAPSVTISTTGTSYVEARSLDRNGNLSASRIQAITIDPAQFGSVAGTVTGPGGALAGVQVSLHGAGSPGVLGTRTTGADGAYRFDDLLASGDYKVLADDVSDVHVDEWFDDASTHGTATAIDVPGGGTATRDIALALTPGVVAGTVSGPGGPLEGITVELHAAGSEGVVESTSTAADGTYAIDVVPGSYKVEFADPTGDHLTEWYDDQGTHGSADAVAVTGSATTTVDAGLALTPGALGGTVSDANGPVAGVEVRLHAAATQGPVATATTAADGTYGFPLVTPGSYKVEFVDASGVHIGEWNLNKSTHGTADAVAVTRSSTTTVNASLALTPGTVSGTVTDANGAVQGVQVRVHAAATPGVVVSAATSATGAWSVDVVPGSFKVEFVDASGVHIGEWNLNRSSHATADAVAVTRSQTTTVNASLALTPGTVSGTVTDANGPIAGVAVRVHAAATPGVVASTTTSASGVWTVGVVPGSYKVEFVDASGVHIGEWNLNKSTHGLANAVAVARSSTTTVNAVLALTPGTVSGTVTDANGAVQGVQVRVHAAATPGVVVSATTSATGAWSVDVVPGSYKVEFVGASGVHIGEWNLNRSSHATADAVAVTRSQTTTVNASLALAPGTVSGTVTDANGAVQGVQVRVHAAATPGVVVSATSSATGAWSADVVPGSYKVEFVDASGVHVGEWNLNRSSHATADAVVVTRSQTTVVNASLALSPGSIVGTVRGPGGQPIEGIAVTAGAGSDTTDAGGAYAITGLAPADYTVTFAAVPCSWLGTTAPATVPTAGGSDTVDAELAPEPIGPHGLTGVPAWIEPAVRWLVNDCNDPQFMTGLTDGSFGASIDISRGQALRAIHRVLGEPVEDTPHGLTGVPAWIEPAVRWAVAHDYMTGFPDGSFRADAPISRGQIARLLFRLEGEPPGPPYPPHGLTDVGAWIEPAVRWMVAEGHVTGINGSFQQNVAITRAQFAQMVFRTYG